MAEIAVLHRDEHLVVVDKPPGLLTVPAPGRSGANLIDLVRRQLGQPVQAVHRLDEDTSGALVVAVSDVARKALDGLFRAHIVERVYLALLTRTPSPPAGRIEARLREVAGVVQVVARGGETAITHYEVLARRDRTCLVQCRLETGRRNQIRVHMAELGCPLAGDRKYGYRVRPGDDFRRVMLHSWRIAFVHPILGGEVRVEVAAPEPELRP